MKKLLLIAGMAIFTALAACNNSDGQVGNAAGQQATRYSTLPAAEYDQKLSATSDAQLVDVRTPSEYGEGHLKGAKNIDVSSAEFDTQVASLDKSRPVFVYCHSGKRSTKAADKLTNMGFREIYNLDGGIVGWADAGKPVEK